LVRDKGYYRVLEISYGNKPLVGFSDCFGQKA